MTTDPYACPTCGEECAVNIDSGYLILVCVPCQMREMAEERQQQQRELQKLAEWNAWARGTAGKEQQ